MLDLWAEGPLLWLLLLGVLRSYQLPLLHCWCLRALHLLTGIVLQILLCHSLKSKDEFHVLVRIVVTVGRTPTLPLMLFEAPRPARQT